MKLEDKNLNRPTMILLTDADESTVFWLRQYLQSCLGQFCDVHIISANHFSFPEGIKEFKSEQINILENKNEETRFEYLESLWGDDVA